MKKEEEKKKAKVFELILGEDDMKDGVSTISFVEFPAIEENFMFFSKETEKYKFAHENDKFMVTGPAMIPNQKILRLDKDDNEFFVFFSEATIAKSQELFFKRAQHISSNVEHMFAIDGVSVVESWIIEDPKNDKSNALGFEGFPKGTWMVSYKIDNESLWEGIKNGEVKGFSIEGSFIEEMVKMSKPEDLIEEVISTEDKIYNDIKDLFEDDKTDEEIYKTIKEIMDIDFEEPGQTL